MGYITNFQLKISGNQLTEEEIKIIKEKTPLEHYSKNLFGEHVKWYCFSEDMKEVSKLIPNRTFTLDGYGEEAGDIWTAYFKNGKSQDAKARIVREKCDL